MSSRSRISIEEFNRLAEAELPLMAYLNVNLVRLDAAETILRARCEDASLRPGGTVAGPVMMALADAAFFAVIMANIGMVKLAVTTNLSINFLRKPGPGDLDCHAGILKLGKRLAVCEARLYTGEFGRDKPVAHATGTYSIPPS